MTRWLCVVLAWFVCSCSEPNLKRSSSSTGSVEKGFPGHEPPPIAELLEHAKSVGAPSEKPEPYAPRMVAVPPLAPTFAHALPAAASGKPFVSEVGGIQVVVDESLRDPITAKGMCLQLTADCIQSRDTPNRRDLDSCMSSAPTCVNNQPWAKTTACCSSACQQLYEGLRKAGYSMMEAADRVDASECFPSLREFMQAAKQRDSERAAAPGAPGAEP